MRVARRQHQVDWVRFVAAFVVAAGIVWQFLQPLTIDRVEERQSEFAWEMFSKGAPEQEFVVVEAGEERTVVPGQVLPIVRTYIDYRGVLPEYLCEDNAAVAQVGIRLGDGTIEWQSCS